MPIETTNKKDDVEWAVLEDNRVRPIVGTHCGIKECQEHGCCFPDCAIISNESFASLEVAKKWFPNIQLIE